MRSIVAGSLILFLGIISAQTSAQTDSERAGDILHLLVPAAAFGVTLWHESDYSGSWQLLKSGLASRLAVETLKHTITKQRPDGSGDDSFPSGHAADTFAAATFVQQRYGWQWSIPAYIGAAYVGYTRVDSERHETEDVLVGALIGVVSGGYFTNPYPGMTITPVAANGDYGFYLSASF